MDDLNMSEKTAEVAEPLPQEPITEQEPVTSVNNVEVAEPIQGEKPVQTKDDNAIAAAARRDAEKRLRETTDKMEAFAKSRGFNNFAEMESYAQAQQYVEQGYDQNTAQKLANVDKLLHETQALNNKARIESEKAKMQNAKFFKELEPDIDLMLETAPNLSVEVAYKYVIGEKFEELMSKGSKAAAQKALNNANSKSHMRPEEGGVEIDETIVDEGEFDMYRRLNPKATKAEYAKFVKSEKRR